MKNSTIAFLSATLLLSQLSSIDVAAQNFCNNEIVLWSEDFGTGLTASSDPNITNLSYQQNGVLSTTGTYRVINVGDQDPNWHKVPDHTPGDENGKMAVINAKQGEFYSQTAVRPNGYVAGYYSFHYFLINLMGAGNCGPNTLLPVITINAEYLDANNNWVSLQNSPVTSAPVPETQNGEWVHLGGIFSLPTTGNFTVTTMRFTLIDETVGGCGNDFAIDDLKFSNCSDGGPLPVVLTNIKAQKKGTGVNIMWSTTFEANNESFEIERSNDAGATWVMVAKTAGSGNSNVTKNYSAYDAKPVAGINYYRVKQIDYDGTFKYSQTVTYKLVIDQIEIAVLANPFSNLLTIDILSNSGKTLSGRLIDNTGRLVKTQPITVAKGSSRKIIETGNLGRGMYVLQVTDENGQVLFTDKLIKQ